MCSHMIARGGTSKDRARLTPEQAASGADREFSELLLLLLCPIITIAIITTTIVMIITDNSEHNLVPKLLLLLLFFLLLLIFLTTTYSLRDLRDASKGLGLDCA